MSDSEATLSLLIKAKNLAGGEISKTQQSLRNLKTGALDGLNVGFMGAAGAAAALTGALIKGIKGAAEEETQIKRLGAVLSANIPAWEGDMDAINKAIEGRQDLGFSDDALRESLIKLVPATKDVSKALDIQRTAMDLARLKGIDLEEASQALVKVEAGQYRALKNLGIVLKDGATQTEALAAVQQVAMGQAAAYSETLAGKTEKLQVKFDNLTEQVGSRLIPILDRGADMLITVMDAMDPDKPTELQDRIIDLGGVIQHVMNPALFGYEDLQKKANKQTYDAAKAMDTYAEKNAAAREPTNNLAAANRGLAKSFLRVQSGIEALAEVQDDIDWLRELKYIYGRTGGRPNQYASGGWAGLNGPEVAILGERGPEYVVPNDKLGSMGGGTGVTIQGVSEREMADIIDRQLYVRIKRAGTAR